MAYLPRVTIFAGSNTTQATSATARFNNLTFAGAGIASLGVSNGSVVISVPAGAPSPVNISAGTTSDNLATIVFSNSNGVVFGLNGSTITASAQQLVGISDIGNTSGTSGIISAGSIVFAGGNGLTIFQSTNANGATLTFNTPDPEIRFVNEPAITQVGTVMGNSLVSIVPIQIPYLLNASNLRLGGSISVATAANASIAYHDLSLSFVIYSRNSDTLSSIASGSNTYSTSWSSNGTASVVGIRGLTAAIGAGSTQFPRGEYWVAVHVSTTNTGTDAASTALGNSLSMLVGATAGTAALGLDPYGVATQATRGASIGLGLISTGVTRASISIGQITQSGTRAMVAKLWLDLRNYSLW